MACPTFDFEFDEEEVMEPPKKKSRFVTVSEVELDELDRKRVPDSTRKTTQKWIKALTEYCKDKGVTCDLSRIGKEELAKLLRHFYVELRQKDGSVYSSSSILGCRTAVQRHLSQDLKRRDIDVYQDEEFKGANITLDGHLKDMKRRGFVKPIEHKDALSDSDLYID